MRAGLLVISACAAFAARPPFTTSDLWQWRTASDPRISRDGQWVAYVEAWNDRAGNATFSNLWIVSADGRTRRRFTEGKWRDTCPRWSPDGARVAWLSDRDGRARIYWRARESGTDTALEEAGAAPFALAWSPDGSSIAFTAAVPTRDEPPAWAPAVILPRLRRAVEPDVQLFIARVDGGRPRQVTRGRFAVVGEAAWMPDGRSLVAAGGDGQIYAIPVDGGPPAPLTRGEARAEWPLPSPDGEKIAWLATRDREQSYATRKLYVMSADGSRARALSGSLDRDATAPQWSSDSRTVYFLADDHGSTYAYAARNDGTVRQATGDAQRLRGFSLADDGRAVSVRVTANAGGDVYTFTVDHVTQPATLAAPNEHLLAEREIAPVEELTYESSGYQVQAWVMKPPAFEASKKYPLLVEARDDPRAMCGAGFELRSQIAAARGFVVMCANPRGTPGYGEQFGNLLPTRFPGDEYEDLMRGVDAVAAKGYIDPARLFLTGGLVTAWAIGHTDRFHRAVARRPITEWATDIAVARDGGRRAAAWMRALPWDDAEQYTRRSPIFFARNFRTPTLVMGMEGDPQAEQLYFALRERKVETAFVSLPVAPSPADAVAELETVLAWLGQRR